MALAAGQEIWIRCKIQPGPFSDERLVTIESVEGPISGFVSNDELKEGADDYGRVRAVIKAVEKDTVTVWVQGSFFTTNGLTNVSRELAMAA